MTTKMRIISIGQIVCYLSKEGREITRRTIVCERKDHVLGAGNTSYQSAAFTVWGKKATNFPYHIGDEVRIDYTMHTSTTDQVNFYTNLYVYRIRPVGTIRQVLIRLLGKAGFSALTKKDK